jgi:large subunit ribosomal protein L11
MISSRLKPRPRRVFTVCSRSCSSSPYRRLPDLNTDDVAVAERIIAGTARSMGIAIDG